MSQQVIQNAGAPGAEDDDEAAAQEASNFLFLLLKGIKNIGIYRHAENRFLEFIQPAYAALDGFLALREVLPLKLGPFTLEYKKTVIYEDQAKENLTYKFYRDGLRYLVFRQGIPPEELLRFVLLTTGTLSEEALFQEDMITRLWKEEFHFIEHVVVEGFGFGELSEEEVEVEVEKIIGYLRKQLSASSEDITRFARLSAEDLELELNDLDQVRGGIVSGRPASDGDKGHIQEELYFEEKNRLFAKMVLILFQILELECVNEDYDMLLESFTQVLDTLLVSEDVKGAVALLQRFETIASRPMPEERMHLVRRLQDAFVRRMVEPQRLDTVGQYLALNRALDEGAVRTYLKICGEDEIVPLVDMLAKMERPDARNILVDVLADIGKKHVEVFARRLDHNSSNVVKDMLAIIHRINPDNKISIVARCLDHPNIMIRLEGLKALAKSEEEIALRYIEKAMQDPDLQLRLGAYRAMAQKSPARAAPVFVKRMQSEGDLSGDDKNNLAKALSGFANSAGGIILWGGGTKHADDGDLNAICDVHPIANQDQKIARLIELSGQLVNPAPEGVRHEAIPWEGKGHLIKTLVPASDAGPHRAAGGKGQYYRRAADSFRYMEHYEIADMFGRRARPKLELLVEDPFLSPSDHPRDGWPSWQASSVLTLRNAGRGMARFPAISLDLMHDDSNLRLHKDGLYGLPQRFKPEHRHVRRPTPVILGGGADDVIHPGQEIDVVQLWIRGYRNHKRVDHIGCRYSLFAEGMPTIEAAIQYDVTTLWQNVIQPWANAEYARDRLPREL